MRPNDFLIHWNLGRALFKEPGRLEDSVAQLKAALRIRPAAAEVHLDLAVALLMAPGRAGEAVAHLEEALRLQPSLEPARRLLARVRESAYP